MSNKNMHAAKKAKNDEFYTPMGEICAELAAHPEYVEFFRGKHVFLNCDDPQQSNFWKFFSLNFMFLGLKQLTATHYDATKPTYRLDLYADLNNDGIIDDKDLVITPLQGNGDFRNQECIDILKQCDVVVTNPPFSLFREYIEQLFTYNKKFVCIANMNSITYKEIFNHVMKEEMWPGYGFNKTVEFMVPDGYKFNREENGIKYGKVPAIMWWTNIDLKKRHTPILLCKEYIGNEFEYPMYDNYNAIECGRVVDIPKDYLGYMGVPITYLGQHCPDQFEIIGLLNSSDKDLAGIQSTREYDSFYEIRQDGTFTKSSGKKTNGNPVLSGKPSKGNYYINKSTNECVHSAYSRIIIKQK